MIRILFPFIFALLTLLQVSAQKIPPVGTGWVTDFEGIFKDNEKHILDSIISDYEKRTTNEIAIITIRDDQTTKEAFDDFVLQIHNTWGVGKKGINNGIVLGISRQLRKIRISTGYGIEGKLTNEEAKNIIDTIMLPEFGKGNMFLGTRNGLLAIINKVK
jgi:uncharacterized protein